MSVFSKYPKLLGVAFVLACAVAACTNSDRELDRDTSSARIDADMQQVLDAQASLNPKPIETLSAAEARKQPSPADGVKKLMRAKGMNPNDAMGVATRNITITINGNPARIYKPVTAKAGDKLPVIVYYHGGGWVLANLDTYDATPRAMAKQVDAIVVSADYRHAPEHRFPAAHDDAFAAYQWVLKNAASIGGDPAKIAVMGESAGGNLAINTSIRARNEKLQMPLYQVLIYPVAGTDMNTESYQQNANAKPLNKAMMGWFMKNVLRNENDKLDARLDLINQADLSLLPPTTIVTAGIDPLRSDGEKLAAKLRQNDVPVHLKNYKGATHEFFGMAAVVNAAKDAQSLVVTDLKTAFDN